MESEDPNPWSSESNWIVVHGDLDNSITFESSFSAQNSIKSPLKRFPLILKPNAPNSNSCEITLSFSQRHELRQIYVKSTARVYEIYCQSNLQSEKEYLWTVKCSAVATNDDDEVSSAHSNTSKENMGIDDNRTGSEDEWVSVKATDGSLESIKPEYYEATAQISDVDPCLSITLRLLSVQSKDSVVVDEVYVFADPVDSTDSDLENQLGHHENTNGSFLSAMLLPSFLQMSKSKNCTGTSEMSEKTNFQKDASLEVPSSSSSNVAAKVQNDGNINTEKIGFQSVKATELQSPEQVMAWDGKVDEFVPNIRVERSLDQLFSRIGRIEDLFLRLEEKLLTPISSIEARLGRVEHQLEELNNRQKNTEQQPVNSRFHAPNVSSIVSDSNTLTHSESVNRPCYEEFEKNAERSLHSEVQSNQLGGIYNFINTDSDVDSVEEDNRAIDIAAKSAVHEPKRALTVEDALASALAGLMTQLENRTPAFTMKAPEFSNDEDTEANEKDSPRGQQGVGTGLSENGSGSSIHDSNHSLASLIVQEENSAFPVEAPVGFSSHEDTEYDKKDLLEAKQDVGADGTEKENCSFTNELVMKPFDDDLIEKIAVEVDERISSKSIDKNEDEEDIELEISSPTNQKDTSSCAVSDPVVEVTVEGSEDGKIIVLLEALEPSFAAPSKVDFELPVLDVKFNSLDRCESNFSLEALLSDLPDSKPKEQNCTEEESLDTIRSENENCDLISVEDCEPVGPVITSQIFMDFNYCSLEEEPVSREDETQLASVIPCSHDSFSTTLI